MEENKQFGQLRLSCKGTNNGNGFDIFYDFKENHDFVEFLLHTTLDAIS